MKTKTKYFHCGDQLQKTLKKEIKDVESAISNVRWLPSFQFSENGNTYEHQTAYRQKF